MNPILIMLLGAAMAVFAGALSATEGAARWWRLSGAMTVLLVAIGVSLATPGDGPGAVHLEARAEGMPAVSRVMVRPEGERRQTYAVPLGRTVAGAPMALGAMALLGALGLLVSTRRRGLGLMGLVLPVAAAAGGAVLFFGVAASGGGEPAVRAFLQAQLAGVQIERFTVPERWTYESAGLAWACLCAAVLGLPALARGLGLRAPLGAGVAVGAALATAGLAWQLAATGGPWWTPAEGLGWAVVLLLGAAALVGHPAARATLCGLGAAMAALGLVV